jgi:ABC-2 type transport system permease protein
VTNLAPVELLVPEAPPARRYGLDRVLRAELVKLGSLRSTIWTLLVTVVGTLGVTVLATNGVAHHSPGGYEGFDPTNQALTGLALATLAIGVLGVLAVTGEYATGTIHSSLAAAPRRPLFLAAKVVVVGAVALAVGEIMTLACFGLGQVVLSAGGAPTAALHAPGVARAVLLSGAYLALLGLLGLGLGVMIRHTAGAMAAFVGITFLLPVLLQRIPGSPARFAPEQILANSVAAVVPQSGQLSAPVGFGMMVLYSVAVLAIAAALFTRRDA